MVPQLFSDSVFLMIHCLPGKKLAGYKNLGRGLVLYIRDLLSHMLRLVSQAFTKLLITSGLQ